ncbi:Uncharacterised protein [Moraxella bovis]|uniref:Uncharacterized protein n=1 Tax=Moraxella bovis TaxID=476 RepID=A0A378PTF2_MORBO|nr:Uncharacterised protein [Moraxella bovis]
MYNLDITDDFYDFFFNGMLGIYTPIFFFTKHFCGW